MSTEISIVLQDFVAYFLLGGGALGLANIAYNWKTFSGRA